MHLLLVHYGTKIKDMPKKMINDIAYIDVFITTVSMFW